MATCVRAYVRACMRTYVRAWEEIESVFLCRSTRLSFMLKVARNIQFLSKQRGDSPRAMQQLSVSR